MSSEQWLTYEEIKRVADNLWQKKRPITARTLYDAVGQRGSLATLQKHLMQWRQEVDILPEPPDDIAQAVKKVWHSIECKTHTTLAQAQEQHAEELQILREQNTAIDAEKEALQAALNLA